MSTYRHLRSPLVLAIATALLFASRAATVGDAVGERVDRYLTRLAGVGFSGSVIVAKDGSIALEKAYGLADRTTGRPITVDTPLLVGSITKQFTAAAILKLEMAGKLQVTDPIGKYFPTVPADKRGITLHHLLTHSAGLESDYGSGDAEQVSREEFVRRVFERPLRTPPGTEYHYSNAGYSLLGMIIESLSGQSWEEFLHDRLFVPAGMLRTGAKLSRFDATELAHGYVAGEDRGRFLDDYGPDGPHWNQRANGGVFSTPRDMYRWHLALQSDKILSAEARKKLFTPFVREGPDAPTYYGYGWVVGKTPRGTTLIEHNGGNGVFSADFKRFVDEDLVIYVASNSADIFAWQVAPVIERIVFGREVPLPPAVASLPTAELQQFAGTYAVDTGGRILVAVKGGQLFATGEGQGAVELIQPEARAHRARCEDVNRRTHEIVGEGQKGNDEPLRKAAIRRPGMDEFLARRQSMREEDRRQFGAFTGVTVLGTTLGPEDRWVTLVRVNFDRGHVFERYVWEGGRQLLGVRRVDEPGGMPFYPTADGALVSYAIQSGKETRLKVERDGEGRPSALVTTGRPPLKAVRGR